MVYELARWFNEGSSCSSPIPEMKNSILTLFTWFFFIFFWNGVNESVWRWWTQQGYWSYPEAKPLFLTQPISRTKLRVFFPKKKKTSLVYTLIVVLTFFTPIFFRAFIPRFRPVCYPLPITESLAQTEHWFKAATFKIITEGNGATKRFIRGIGFFSNPSFWKCNCFSFFLLIVVLFRAVLNLDRSNYLFILLKNSKKKYFNNFFMQH